MAAARAVIDRKELIDGLRAIVGRRYVLTSPSQTRAFTTGYRFGSGPVLAVVRPGTPLEQFRAFRHCIAGGASVIVQAANTGLTGGSTPDGEYDRPVVIINTMRIGGLKLIRAGDQVICFAGTTLYELENRLLPIGREPHSVIGSSCIGASVIGGICNNSGGALVRRGPAYTEYALFARVTAAATVELVNHLGVTIAGDEATILSRLFAGQIEESDIVDDRSASADDYATRVRDIGAGTPARFNADPSKLFEASGSAGKLMVIAVRLDTFPRDERTATFYIGTSDPSELSRLRRRMLSELSALPVSGEYIHRTAFDIATAYGKDMFLAIETLGTSRLPALFAWKNRIDALARRLPFVRSSCSDQIMHAAARLFGSHLPKRMIEWRDRYEHHLIVKVADAAIDEARELLEEIFPSATGAMFECTMEEARKAFLHRFAIAGAAVRYRAVHAREIEDIIALDIALPRNDENWFERLPEELSRSIIAALYYGHFFCHVFHQDYIVRKGVDPIELEHRMWKVLDARGAEYPAEHNVGRLYPAKPALAAHYRALDPCNALNPGIGQTSRNRGWI